LFSLSNNNKSESFKNRVGFSSEKRNVIIMIVEKKLIKNIKDLGLNSYEAKIWTALLSRAVSTAGVISDIANVPRSRSYDVLESLEKKGFIIMKVGRPIQYISVPPEEVLERVKKNVMIDAEQVIDSLNEFQNSDLLTELTSLHDEGIENVDPTEMAGYVKGRNNVYDQMRSMIKKAGSSVLLSLTEKSFDDAQENLSKALNKASKNVNIMVSSPSDFKGFNVKNLGLSSRFLIVDSSKVLFTITNDETHPDYDTAVWIESSNLAQTFEQMFTILWDSGKKAESKFKVTVSKKVN